eukprot:scaffold1743_cov115-Pinguiococcus_pyrenoidosus.AAC.1
MAYCRRARKKKWLDWRQKLSETLERNLGRGGLIGFLHAACNTYAKPSKKQASRAHLVAAGRGRHTKNTALLYGTTVIPLSLLSYRRSLEAKQPSE